ncbi:MAG: hypothetical protein U9R50_03950 [Campylobacterota bacterium]|nr:hypothetical protein [Campylobacterota bacterium]
MKSKTMMSITSIALLFLSSISLANDANNTRLIQIPEVPQVTAVVPEVPKVTAVVPTAVQVETQYPDIRSNKAIKPNRANQKIDFHREFKHKRNTPIIFSKRTPPTKLNTTFSEDNLKVGDIKNSRVSLYLRGAYLKPDVVKTQLEKAGFNIVSSKALDKKKKLVSIVFTNDALVKMADKKDRAFSASLRVLVNKKDNEISFLNPLYVTKAFMQDDYDDSVSKAALESIRTHFEGLKDSEDIVKNTLLPKYVFMSGMPGYNDMVTVGKGTHAKLLAKAKKSKKTVFVQELSKNRALVGVKLGKRTTKFIKKTGTTNAALLPYPVMIENGEAKILEPKYYIAVMYPLLKMGTFMKISTVPGAINNDVKKIFK